MIHVPQDGHTHTHRLTLPKVEKLSWNKKDRISTRSIPLDWNTDTTCHSCISAPPAPPPNPFPTHTQWKTYLSRLEVLQSEVPQLGGRVQQQELETSGGDVRSLPRLTDRRWDDMSSSHTTPTTILPLIGPWTGSFIHHTRFCIGLNPEVEQRLLCSLVAMVTCSCSVTVTDVHVQSHLFPRGADVCPTSS